MRRNSKPPKKAKSAGAERSGPAAYLGRHPAMRRLKRQQARQRVSNRYSKMAYAVRRRHRRRQRSLAAPEPQP